MQEAFHAALSRRLYNGFGSTVVDRMEIAFPRQPHPGQAGKVIDLVDAFHRPLHQVAIEHRAPDMLDLRQGAERRLKIENPHLPLLRDER